LEILQTVGATVLAITLIYNNDWMRNSGDQMNTAGCQLAGNCQPASTLFWHRKILRSYVSRADKRYGCASFGIAIAVNASLKEDDHLVEGRLIRLGAVRGDFGDEMPKML
jgi:hypothetical protein